MWKYASLWIGSFIAMSAVDAFWHLVLFGKAYSSDIRKIATVANDKLVLRPVSGLLSQVLVVTCLVFLVSLQLKSGRPYFLGALSGMAAGILAISVYGLVNYFLFSNWNLRLTVLEMLWGPIIGVLSGLFVVWFSGILKI